MSEKARKLVITLSTNNDDVEGLHNLELGFEFHPPLGDADESFIAAIGAELLKALKGIVSQE